MNNSIPHRVLFPFLGFGLIVLILINLGVGSVFIPIGEIISGLLGGEFSKKSWEIIIYQYRIPKAFTAVLAGVALAVSGIQMQTFFRNPLAGPFVLGISSGAGLGVAILVLTGSVFGLSLFSGGVGGWAVVIAATTGAILVLLLMSLTAWKVKDSMTLLIVGLMFGSLAGAVVSVLAYFSDADQLKVFTVWSMGSLGGTTISQLKIFCLATFIGLIPVLIFIKSYNAMLLGEAYAESMGVNIRKLRWAMIISTGILAGSATAFCGPIAFIGIAVPHMARIIFKTADHSILIPASLLLGAIVLLICDSISQLPGSAQSLPINAVTSLVGAPMVIWLILKRNFSKEF
ncbi:iron complex transport system permease protein [Belliella buryatensis]|uniref:Iron complex transport system permease protein n=1 Tax=Belliella buryatensis TaxID=1500549 RepID=A0A239GTX4_9BACT|nr:iron ABC transporter permease [Belliella buryatensis]SNS71524.1 iron complex transport system permease protein [Belliella buryatensis]